MPSKNPYFNFLAVKNSDDAPIAIGDSHYRKLPLPDAVGNVIRYQDIDYTVDEAYLRIQETIEIHKDEYYFMAGLKQAGNGREFELAVAFNTEDMTSGLQVLKDVASGEVFHLTGDGAFLKQLARTYSLPAIKQLKANHTEAKTQYLAEIDEALTALLAKDQASVSQDAIDALIEKAETLESMGGAPRSQLLENYKAIIELSDFPYASKHAAESSEGDEEWLVIADDELKTLSLLRDVYDKIQAQKRNHEVVSIEDALAYYEQTQAAFNISFDGTYHFTSENVQLIHSALMESHALCMGLLERALITGNQTVYEEPRMAGFAPQAKEQVLMVLMKLNKLSAFQWLLTQGSFALNCIDAKLAPNDTYEAPLLEIAASLQNKQFFKALLDASASPLFLTRRGIPFAFDIFQRQDALTVALNTYLAKQPAGSIVLFFAQLKQLIGVSLLNTELEGATRAAMEAFLPNCQFNQENLQGVAGFKMPSKETLADAGVPKEHVQRFIHTQTVQLALEAYAEARTAYRLALTTLEQPAFKSQQYASFESLLAFMRACPPVPLNQSEVTETVVLKRIQDETRYCQDGRTLLEAASAYGAAYQQRKQAGKKGLGKLESAYKSASERFMPQAQAKSGAFNVLHEENLGIMKVAIMQQVATASMHGVQLIPQDELGSNHHATQTSVTLG